METIQITKENALKAYKVADKKGKELLASLLGEKSLYEKITDRVKTFEDACEVLGINPSGLVLSASVEFEKDEKSILSYSKLILIARALNEGWAPDWNNHNQYKYYPWFKPGAGFGLSFFGCDFTYAGTFVGSRLCFKDAELAKYAATQFADLYNDYLTL